MNRNFSTYIMRNPLTTLGLLLPVVFFSILVSNVAKSVDEKDSGNEKKTLTHEQPKKYEIEKSMDHLMWFLQVRENL